jgi:hypothetical protein
VARAKIIDPLESDAEREAQELAELNEDEDGELFRVVDELRAGGGTSVLIVKVTPREEQGYCGEHPIGEFSLDMLRNSYGTGSYRIRVRGPDKKFRPGGGIVNVSGVAIKKPLPGTGGEFQTALEFMRQQQIERDAKQSKLLELAIPALGTVIAAFLNRPQGNDVAALVTALKPAPGPTLGEISQMMINFKAMSTPEKQESSVDSFIKIFEAAKDLAGDGGGGKTGWLDLAKEAMGALPQVAGPFLQGIATRRGMVASGAAPIVTSAPLPNQPHVPALVPAPSPLVASVAQPIVAPASVPSSGNNEMMFFKPMIQAKLKVVSQWITDQKDPELYAEIFLREHVPSSIQDFLPPEKALEYLRHEKWFDVVCEWEPTLVGHRDWCDKFRLELIGFITDSINPVDEMQDNVVVR